MGTITGQQIIADANAILMDNGTRWLESEHLSAINAGQRAILELRPDAKTSTAGFQLAPGSTRQTLPDNAIRLLNMPRNLGADGATPGRAIRLIDMDKLDAVAPDWHVTPTRSVIEHFMYDIKVPRVFWVYPKPSAAVHVELHTSIAPIDLADPASKIDLDDIYANALLEYVLFRAYAKEAEYAANAALAGVHYQAFQGALGVRLQSDAGVNPNNKLKKAEIK